MRVSYKLGSDNYVELWSDDESYFPNIHEIISSKEDERENTKEVQEKFKHFNDFYGDYKLTTNGLMYDASHDYKIVLENKRLAREELKDLLDWFTWYDQQVIQAGRAERLNLEWGATDDDGAHYTTLQQLDEAATLKAETINSLRQ